MKCLQLLDIKIVIKRGRSIQHISSINIETGVIRGKPVYLSAYRVTSLLLKATIFLEICIFWNSQMSRSVVVESYTGENN